MREDLPVNEELDVYRRVHLPELLKGDIYRCHLLEFRGLLSYFFLLPLSVSLILPLYQDTS